MVKLGFTVPITFRGAVRALRVPALDGARVSDEVFLAVAVLDGVPALEAAWVLGDVPALEPAAAWVLGGVPVLGPEAAWELGGVPVLGPEVAWELGGVPVLGPEAVPGLYALRELELYAVLGWWALPHGDPSLLAVARFSAWPSGWLPLSSRQEPWPARRF